MNPFLIQPHNPYGKGIKKTWQQEMYEQAEAEEILHRIILEKSAIQQNQNLSLISQIQSPSSQHTQNHVASSAAGAGGSPPYKYFHPVPFDLSYSNTTNLVSGSFKVFAYSPTLQTVVIGEEQPNGTVLTSSNGTDWAIYVSAWRSGSFNLGGETIWGNDIFASAEYWGISSSPNGANWTKRRGPSDGINKWCHIEYSPELGKFVAINRDTLPSANVITSSNGINWSNPYHINNVLSYTGEYNSEIAWSPELGVFCFAAINNTYISSDLETFSNFTTLGTTDEYSIYTLEWSPELGVFCAASAGNGASVGSKIITSTDGINWTIRYQDADSLAFIPAMKWISQWGMFVGIYTKFDVPDMQGQPGEKLYMSVITSTDGINWNIIPIVTYNVDDFRPFATPDYGDYPMWSDLVYLPAEDKLIICEYVFPHITGYPILTRA